MTLEIPLPPAIELLAHHPKQREYALEVHRIIAPEIQRIDTPGFSIDVAWPCGDGMLEVKTFYCFACGKLHSELYTERGGDSTRLPSNRPALTREVLV